MKKKQLVGDEKGLLVQLQLDGNVQGVRLYATCLCLLALSTDAFAAISTGF